MKVAYVTNYDAKDIRIFGGTGYYMAKSLINQSISIEYIGPLIKKNGVSVLLRALFWAKRNFYNRLYNKRYYSERDKILLKYYSAPHVYKKLIGSKVRG